MIPNMYTYVNRDRKMIGAKYLNNKSDGEKYFRKIAAVTLMMHMRLYTVTGILFYFN